jgi:ubiquinone/menaquinone biosynthesis C-methylase UbiE
VSAAADADELKRFRAGVFGRGASDYDQIGRPITAQMGRRLVEFADLRAGQSVLDIATGRGAVLFPAAEAVGPEGRVVGIDLAAEMVELTAAAIATAGIANAEARIGDAERLDDFEKETFDCVTGAFAIFFLPDPLRALREFRRVLRPGGSVALSSWGAPDPEYSWFGELRERLGIERVPLETLDFESTEELEDALAEAGLVDVRTERVPVEFALDTPETWWRWVLTGASRATIESLPEPERERFRNAALERAREVYGGDPITLSEEALFAIASKPTAAR